MRLYDKHRPTTLDDVVGQPKAVAQARGLIGRGALAGGSIWISGASGTGKTTLARILAAEMADPFNVTEFDSADQFNQATFDALSDACQFRGMGVKSGRVWIINEAHGLRAPIIRQLLGLMERLPEHCTIIFTTTRDGEDALFDDQIDAGPFTGRCLSIRLTNQGLAKPFAERALLIARAEGLDGQPIEAYIKLAQRCKNSMRAMLTEIASGAMLAA